MSNVLSGFCSSNRFASYNLAMSQCFIWRLISIFFCNSWQPMTQSWQPIETFSPCGFLKNTALLAYVGVPLEINRSAFGCLVSVPPGAFLSAAMLFLHCCLSRLRWIGTVWLAVWRHGGRSHSALSQRLLDKCVEGQRVLGKKCIYVGVYVCVFSRFNFYAFMLILWHLPVDTNVCVYPSPAMY